LAELAFIEVRAFPWRLRARVMKPDTLRDAVDPLYGIDDLAGVVVGFVLWLFVIVAAPVLVVLLAALLLPFELSLLIGLALLLVAARLVGVVPWTVGIVDERTGAQRREQTRSLLRAVRIVREANGTRRVPVRWSWS
jgi:hypothetical protein